jgi:GrpB-like predicted nucleotidyltransferase (UPF0157 family)
MGTPITPWGERTPFRGVGPHEHDARAFAVAERVASLVVEARPSTRVEHIGSTAVPGLPGKGIVDLVIEAEPDEIHEIMETLLRLGFERQTDPDPFPPTRPLLQGCMDYDGDVFGLHCHVVPNEDGEVFAMREFRDRLRENASLRKAYVAEKRRIVQGGVIDADQYTAKKSDFIMRTLREMGSLK